MNKIILTILFLLTLSVNLFSQYSIPLRLVNSDGTPKTGQASNIVFTRYPHSYGTDNVSGITVTEVGTAGNYVCKGFTTYEYVKLWLSGVNQTWFDSVQVGNISTYINTLLGSYMNKTGTQSGFTGTKTLTGDWLWTSGTITLNKPYVYTSSPWYTDYSLIGNSSLGWKGLNDSLYVLRDWMFLSGSKIILQSGYKIWGLANTQPIQIYTSQFSWDATNGLTLQLPYQQDSMYIKKDTIIGENTYTKSWSLRRTRFNQVDSLNLWLKYRNSYASTQDSFQLINNVINIASSDAATNLDSADYSTIQTWNFPYPAFWDVHIYYEYEFEYVTPLANCYDSIYASAWNSTEYTDPAFLMADNVNKYAYIASTPTGLRGTGELSFQVKITTGNIADTYSFAGICSGIAHKSGGSAKSYIRKWKIIATKIR